MRKTILIVVVALMLSSSCSAGKRADQTTKTTPDTIALATRVNDIYTDVFSRYGSHELEATVFDTSHPNADSLYCSQDWNSWVDKVKTSDEAHNDGMIGFFEADYWIMGQDWQDLSVSDIQIMAMTDSTAVVKLNIHNCGSITNVNLEMVNENGEWKIDNFIDISNDLNWKASMKEYLENE